MKTRRVLLFLGSLWDFARFFLILSILAALFGNEGGWAAAILPWLLLSASSCLLVPVGGLLLSLYPDRYANLAAFLRLGKILNLFSFILLLLAGSLGAGARIVLFRIGQVEVTHIAALPAVALFDLLFFIILVSFKTDMKVEEGNASLKGEAEILPDDVETKIEDYH